MSNRDKVFIVSGNDSAARRLFQTITAAKAYAQTCGFSIVEQFKPGKSRKAAMVFEGFHYVDFGDESRKWAFCPQVSQ